MPKPHNEIAPAVMAERRESRACCHPPTVDAPGIAVRLFWPTMVLTSF